MTYQEIAYKTNERFGYLHGQIKAEDVQAYIEKNDRHYIDDEEADFIDWLTDDGS